MAECFVFRWLLLCLLLIPRGSPTPEGDTLLKIMNKWGVARPSDWTGDDPCASNWEGVRCDTNRQVSHLNLTYKGLVGEIPTEMGSLKGLVNLDLSNVYVNSTPLNVVTGDLSALFGLSNLQSLNVSRNPLKSSFPSVVLEFTGLTDLRLDGCSLTGKFPQGLSKLNKLKYLYMGNNLMMGAMPSELGSLTSLIELSLWNFNFTSTIVHELALLQNLRYLNLHGCRLFGGLPPEFGNLSNMEKMHLYDNTFTGPIPETWRNMKKLTELRLSQNQLTDTFPKWILNSTSLSLVDLSYNYLYGPVSNINGSSLQLLNIACNYFSGPNKPTTDIPSFFNGQNCFQEDEHGDHRSICNLYYTCDEFNKKVSESGDCPKCPPDQSLSNKTTCICLGVASPSPEVKSNSSKQGTMIGIVVGVLIVILVGLAALFAFKRCKSSQRKGGDSNAFKYGQKFEVKESQGYWDAPKGVQRFSLAELLRATSNFSVDHEIGAGGFGKVFYGKLEHGKEVAIKRASCTSMQGGNEFRNEVELLSRLHHRNLVRLEGFCDDNDLQILVYEYVPNGNLHSHLFKDTASHSFGWLRRLDIAVGIAQGLDYLHSFADPPVIHRDVKASNVLLDDNLVAKLADFGISRTTMESETHVSTIPAGTAGYIDPQYFLRQQLTTASDVYGFGVVLLELITGRKAIDPKRIEDPNLVEWVKTKMKLEGIEGIIDPRMVDDFPVHIYEIVAELAISCTSFNKNDRPEMKEAVSVLDGCLRSVCPPPTTCPPPEKYVSAMAALETETINSDEGISYSSVFSATKNSAFRSSLLMPR